MRHNPKHFDDDPAVVKPLIRENPGHSRERPRGRFVASRYPLLLDEDGDELAVFTHVGRPDEELHGLGESELLLIVQGVHGDNFRVVRAAERSARRRGTSALRTATASRRSSIPTATCTRSGVWSSILSGMSRSHCCSTSTGPRRWRAARARHPRADPPLPVQDQAEPGQGSANPAPGDRAAPAPGAISEHSAGRRDAAHTGAATSRSLGEPHLVAAPNTRSDQRRDERPRRSST